MIQKAKILFFCMIFVVSSIFAQNNLENYGYTAIALNNYSCFSDINLEKLRKFDYTEAKRIYAKKNYNKIFQKSTNNFFYNYNIVKPVVIINPNFYTQNFGFFCKKELQLQKVIKVPFVFRLGSVEMCDRLEGK